MKTLNFVLAGFLVLALAFTSCQKDNEFLSESNAVLKTDDKDGGPDWIADPLTSYPNPFTDITTVKYRVDQPSKVVLVVVSPDNNNLTYLVQAFMRPGSYQIKFDATGWPAGEYVAHLRIGNRVFKEKMKKVTSTSSDPHLTN